jgi:hypothetical protein
MGVEVILLEKGKFPRLQIRPRPRVPHFGVLRVTPTRENLRKYSNFLTNQRDQEVLFCLREIVKMPHFDEKKAYAAQEDVFVRTCPSTPSANAH